MAQLPPKIPPPSTNWPAFPPHQRMPSLTSISPSIPSTTTQQPSWVDEFLDFTSSRRGNHRRSMSDSIAFLEPTALLEECRNSTSSLQGGGHSHNHHNNSSHGGFDKLDDEQLMSMFSDDFSAVAVAPPPAAANNSSNPSTPNSDQNSNNNNDEDDNKVMNINAASKIEPVEQANESSCDHKNGTEESLKQQDQLQQFSNGNTSDPNNDNGPIDPKRVKRILANRQSAQRSRVRKLQYISELERSVTSLQTEVSALSPRVAFLDHQRLILNVDNSALKQRIAALAQDKIFKDAHQEALKKEIERLRQIYHQQQQNMKIMANNGSDTNMACAEKEQLMA